MLKKIIPLLALCLVPACGAAAKLNIAASSTDMAYIAAKVAGENAEVKSLASGGEDQHYVEARPSMVMALKNADAFVRIGMELDMWADALVIAAKNGKVTRGAPGDIDASADIQKLDVPAGRIDLAMGDVHAFGNPHYWLDPENAAVAAGTLAKRLSALDPERAAEYQANAKAFAATIAARLEAWQKRMAPFRGRKIVVYHDSWPYFAKRFGLVVAGYIEPKPGIPPSPAHIAELVEMMKRENASVILCETYFNGKAVKSLAGKTGAKTAAVPLSTGGAPDADSYEALIELIISRLEKAFK